MLNKNKQSGFINLIIIIVVGLLLMRHYGVSLSDAIDWLKNISLEQIIGWFKDLVDWCKRLLNSIA